MRRIILLLVLAILLTGCASVLNPYESDFQCPDTDRGKCVSVQDAYGESMQKNSSTENKDEVKSEKPQEGGVLESQHKKNNDYQEALYKELAGLLKEPLTPIVAPPKVMRVLLLPYKGDSNELYMIRYVYFFVEEPKWILGDYLQSTTHRGAGNE
jgi:conjugal transfer pilus assembly protein TraV